MSGYADFTKESTEKGPNNNYNQLNRPDKCRVGLQYACWRGCESDLFQQCSGEERQETVASEKRQGLHQPWLSHGFDGGKYLYGCN